MEYFDKNIGNEFHQDFDQSIPEGFEWDAMKSGIQSKMNTEPPRRKRRFVIWFFMIAGLLISFTIYLLNTDTKYDTTPLPTVENKIELQTTTDHLNSTSRSYTTATSKDEKNSTSSVREVPKAQSSIKLTDAAIQKTNIEPTKTTTPTEPLAIASRNERLSDSQKQQINQKSNDLQSDLISNSNHNKNKINSSKNVESLAPSVKIQIKNLIQIVTPKAQSSANIQKAKQDLPSISNSIEENKHNNINRSTILSNKTCKPLPLNGAPLFPDINTEFEALPAVKIPQINKNVTRPGYVGLSAGISFWSGKNKGTPYAVKRNTSTTHLPGFHIKANKSYAISNQVNLNVGLGYQELFEKFEAQVIVPKETLFIDELLRTHRSLITGRMTETRGDTLVKSDEIRTVRHYNAFKTISLDISIAKKWKLSPKSQIIWSAGPSMSILTHASGKTLGKDDTIIEFNATNQIYKSNHWAVRTGLNYQYNISNRCGIHLGASMKKYLSNISKEQNNTFNPTVYDLSLGLNMKIY